MDIKDIVGKRFPRFGVNKRQEIARLLYEISKKEDVSFECIIDGVLRGPTKFADIKDYLTRRRFPRRTASPGRFTAYLPDLDLDPSKKASIKKRKINPKNIYADKKSEKSPLSIRLKKAFPRADFKTITSLKGYIKDKRFDIKDHNRRRDNFFVVREGYDFFKHCPCTSKALSCGYNIFNLGFGCVFECAYCYLQEYTNSPGIILPSNIEDFFKAFKGTGRSLRIGTGEFTDSLALDSITGFSTMIIDFFRRHPDAVFEFKTKSDNIKNIISAKPADNIVISWSLNPQSVIETEEHHTVSLERRLDAAIKCVKAGFTVGFHFDPILDYEGWEIDYKRVVDQIFSALDRKTVRWISLGTLRFAPALKKTIEMRFPQTRILDGELAPDFDRKMRYSESIRIEIYRKMLTWIRERSERVPVYLCMENKNVWKSVSATSRKGLSTALL